MNTIRPSNVGLSRSAANDESIDPQSASTTVHHSQSTTGSRSSTAYEDYANAPSHYDDHQSNDPGSSTLKAASYDYNLRPSDSSSFDDKFPGPSRGSEVFQEQSPARHDSLSWSQQHQHHPQQQQQQQHRHHRPHSFPLHQRRPPQYHYPSQDHLDNGFEQEENEEDPEEDENEEEWGFDEGEPLDSQLDAMDPQQHPYHSQHDSMHQHHHPQHHPHHSQQQQQQQNRPLRPQSSHEVHSSNFISEDEFLLLADDYLLSLSPKKREKALLSNTMYEKILMVLLQPKNTQVSTAQFRFWAKKMFTLSTTATHHIVCHDGKPVATKECLYDVLVYCHRKSAHGGRDKTSAEVRQHYSWVPKELIARFVKHCPLCSSRRHSLPRPPSLSGAEGSGGMGGYISPFGTIPTIDEADGSHYGVNTDPGAGGRVDSLQLQQPQQQQQSEQQRYQEHRLYSHLQRSSQHSSHSHQHPQQQQQQSAQQYNPHQQQDRPPVQTYHNKTEGWN